LTTISERVPVLRQLVYWWRGRRHSRRATDERNCCGLVSVERVARDVGVSTPERHVLAGKWPAAFFTIDLSQGGKSDGDGIWIVPLLNPKQAHHGGP